MVFFINKILKSFFLNMFAITVFYKIDNQKFKLIHILGIFTYVFMIAILYAVIRNYIDMISAIIINVFLVSILLKILTKQRLSKIIIGMTISNSTVYVLYAIAITLEYPIQKMVHIYSRTLNGIIVYLLEIIFVFLCIKARKLKNGLQFLQNSNEYIETLSINIALTIIVMYSLVGMSKGERTISFYTYFAILSGCMILSISKVIKMYYKQKLTKNTIDDYVAEIEKKDNEIKRLTDENYKIHKVNHEFYNKQKALEKKVNDYVNTLNTESGEELGLLDRINEVTKEHIDSIESIKSLDKLPVTEISEIDDMFSYMRKECVDNSIDFSLKVNGNIFYMVNNLISTSKLETLIGDHIRDAIIAINSGDVKNGKILVTIGKVSNCYELCIFDSGIEFEIDTLNKLGVEQVTTHKHEGGSGIGFITTFETMKECNFSIEIEEIGSLSKDNYTKAVKFIFDNKCEYRIKSYRADELKCKLDINRIIIEE